MIGNWMTGRTRGLRHAALVMAVLAALPLALLAPQPTRIAAASATPMVAVGYAHSLALLEDGTLWSWGYNTYAQLGDGTTTEEHTPVQVKKDAGSYLDGVATIASGSYHSLALLNDHTLWSWGRNNYGQLGIGTNSGQQSYPVQVKKDASSYLTGVAAIASSGGSHNLALLSDHTLWSWGFNYYGQLGDGTTTTRLYPVQVKTGASAYLTGIVAAAAAGSHSLALLSDHTVWSFGYNGSGQLGIGTSGGNSSYAVQVQTGPGAYLTGIVAITAGNNHSLALKDDGTLWSWGFNYYGQLGDGTKSSKSYAVQVQTGPGTYLTGVTAIAAGNNYSIALLSDGTLWSWGDNDYGQLGNNGAPTDQFYPVRVAALGHNVAAIAAGGGNYHNLALKSDGTLWSFGRNNYGQLGTGASGTDSPVPVPVGSPFPVVNSITAAPGSVSIPTGGAWQLSVTANMSDGATPDVTSLSEYTASPGSVAAVSASGLITGLEEGTAEITAAYNGRTSAVSLIVDSTAPSLTVSSPAEGSCTQDTYVTVSGAASDSASGLQGLTISVNGGDPSPITVTGDSFSTTVTLDPGDNTITLTAADNAGNTATATLHVLRVTLNVTLDKHTDGICLGSSDQLTATVSPDNAPDKSVTWSSGNTSVATVDDNGLVISVSEGTANITVTTTDGNHTDTCLVTVQSCVPTPPGVESSPLPSAEPSYFEQWI